LICVYIQKWKKEQGVPWRHILADILKKDYGMKQCPEILKDEYGKPYLEGHLLCFNVSHSGEYLAIVISENPVGVDIQKTQEIKPGMYRKVVRGEEQNLIGEERQKDFLRLWALKESFVKADGRGLRISMKDYYFVEENDRYFVNYGGQKCGWTFNIEETLIPDYVISVCGLEQEILWKII
jgi:4'-phosphopantetheinyl transferase